MKIDKGVLERFEKIIIETGFSRSQFAREIGLTASAISEIFSDRRKNLSGIVVKMMEIKLGVNPKWLENGLGDQYISFTSLSGPEEDQLIRIYRSLSIQNQEMLISFCETLSYQSKNQRTIDVDSKVAEKRRRYNSKNIVQNND